MKIADDHLYHGAALTQIAEDLRFTAINPLPLHGKVLRSGFLINTNIALYLKYATTKTKSFGECVFTFSASQFAEIQQIASSYPKTHIVMVCVPHGAICSIPFASLQNLWHTRQSAQGANSLTSLTVLVTAPRNKSFRVYVNQPGVKKTMLGNPIIVSRSAYPSCIF